MALSVSLSALSNQSIKAKTHSQSLRRKLLESEERIDAAEHAVEDERREVFGKARSLVMEADAKRETEVRVLKEQMEEERKRLAADTAKAREEWQQAKLKEMEEKVRKKRKKKEEGYYPVLRWCPSSCYLFADKAPSPHSILSSLDGKGFGTDNC